MKDIKQTQQGSGSSENKGGDRGEQKQTANIEGNQNISRDINEPSSHIAGLKDMGQLSGRDDYAGGSGDGMSEESTGEATDQ